MVASAIFIMDTKGKVIISRNYRGDIPMSVSERSSVISFVINYIIMTESVADFHCIFKKKMKWS